MKCRNHFLLSSKPSKNLNIMSLTYQPHGKKRQSYPINKILVIATTVHFNTMMEDN